MKKDSYLNSGVKNIMNMMEITTIQKRVKESGKRPLKSQKNKLRKKKLLKKKKPKVLNDKKSLPQ